MFEIASGLRNRRRNFDPDREVAPDRRLLEQILLNEDLEVVP